jgi:hypothetical protein
MSKRLALRVLACLLPGMVLAGCAAAPAGPAPELFRDAWFKAPTRTIDTGTIFALDEGMRRFFDERLARDAHSSRALSRLVQELTDRDGLRLYYDSSRTRTAAEAFEAHQGNCLSLVVMTAAFAREMGIAVDFRSAEVADIWGRSGRLAVGSGHIDITLNPVPLIIGARVEERPVSIDFLPPDQMRDLPTHTVPESTVVAMFMNNRAVEALADGRVDDAYAWARAALHEDPDMALAYNTLGVIYRHHGDLAQAAIVLRQALDRQPDSPLALSNLADTLEQLGDTLQGAALRTRLAAIDPDPPFHYYDMGLIAYRHHDYRAARDLFAKEVARAGYYHEFHFWLALAQFRLGRIEDAGSELALARAYSTTQHDRDLYGAKLAWLHGVDGTPVSGTGAGTMAR